LIIQFYKYEGTGNDFIMVDDRALSFPINNTQLIAKLCDRRFGIGADGLILLQPHTELDFYMKYYNSDGKESSMCGNGGRCIAAFAAHINIAFETAKFMAIDGAHEAIIGQEDTKNRFVKLKMKSVSNVDKRGNNTYVLNTGSPHYIQFLEENLTELDVVTQAKINIRTYERGVEDETLSCGTGVTGAALSFALLKKLPSDHYIINVKVLGGELKVSFDFDAEDETYSNIWLQGPATFVYQGTH
jgi:diaminopimelate epimerase